MSSDARLVPSPSKHNPFAKGASNAGTTFKRASLLPSVLSPAKGIQSVVVPNGASPNQAGTSASAAAAAATPSERARSSRPAWRLLWRGGLEVGPDGWRLDGITFFAKMSFPVPGSGTPSNPFGTPTSAAPIAAGSPFDLPVTDTDLCLSLESMRGRKYLQVRGLTTVGDGDILDADGDDGGVQMAISSPLLSAYFTGVLCRSSKLTSRGHTGVAVVIGLGDEGVDNGGSGSTILVYGQRQNDSSELRLCVGRKRSQVPMSAKKVRPGEPLPRAPLLFPSKAPKKRPTILPRRSLSRQPSSASIYERPQAPAPPAPEVPNRIQGRPNAAKRPRTEPEHDPASSELARQSKSGRIRPSEERAPQSTHDPASKRSTPVEEDIFGRRSASVAPRGSSAVPRAAPVGGASTSMAAAAVLPNPPEMISSEAGAEGESSRTKRAKLPQVVLDNKAVIRKQALLLLEARGCARDHDMFKDVFGMVTKGTYFALRASMGTGPVVKAIVQDLIGRHLDMYLPELDVRDQEGIEEGVAEDPEALDALEGPEGPGDLEDLDVPAVQGVQVVSGGALDLSEVSIPAADLPALPDVAEESKEDRLGEEEVKIEPLDPVLSTEHMDGS